MVHSAVDGTYCIFSFHSVYLQRQNFLKNCFYLFVKLLILCIFCLILSNCLSSHSCSSLRFLKKAMLNSFFREIIDLHVFGVSYWKIIVILWCCHVFLIIHISWSLVSLSSKFCVCVCVCVCVFIYSATLGLTCRPRDLQSSLQHSGSLVPWPGIVLRPPALRVPSLSHWATREVPLSLNLKKQSHSQVVTEWLQERNTFHRHC